MKPLHSTILGSAGGVLVALGFASPLLAWLLPIGGAFFLSGLAITLGRLAFPEEQAPLRLLFGLLGALALISVTGSGVYYVYKLNGLGISWMCLAMPWLVFALTPFRPRTPPREERPPAHIQKLAPEDSLSGILLAVTLAADATAIRWLLGARTSEALRTPWEAVSPVYFLWIGLATFCLAGLAYRRRYPHLALAAASIHLFALLAPAALVYGLGYGFDPFVHQAAEKLILSAGQVTPKTPYYIGQYALVSVFTHLFRLPVEIADRFLLPACTALFVPLSAAWLLRRGYGASRAIALVGAFGMPLLPLAPFVATTPQGLSNLFFLLTMLLGAAWLHGHRPPLGYVLLLAAASAASHPLSGIPALLAAALLMAAKLRHDEVLAKRAVKAVVFAFIAIGAVVAVPFVFAAREGRGPAALLSALRTPIPNLLLGLPIPAPGIETRYRPLLDFAEFAARHHDLLLAALAALGAGLLLRRKSYRRSALAAGSLAVALFASAALLKASFTFKDVIGYEQGNYADRLYETALLSLAPLVLAGLAWWWRALARTDSGVRVFFILLFAGLVPALAYASFPRLDEYSYSRGYSPSIHDARAVEWIDAHAQGAYVVLANQSVSAAALRAFGFKTYYGSQFYYSIPTGAPLYQRYLKMVYESPARATMEAAMRDVSVPVAYFVIDDYWTDAPRIIAEAKKSADDWHEIDGGKVYVFRYALK